LPLKDLIMQQAAHFPMLAVNSGSGTGKTTGAVAQLWSLNGRLKPGGGTTTAAFREELSKHRAGVVWVDDVTNVADLGDFIRQCTAEGEHVRRKIETDSAVTRTRMVGPLVISAEGLEILQQKAYAERAVEIDLPDPKERRSKRDPSRLQWEDVKALDRKWASEGGLTAVAGWLVQRILQEADVVSELGALVTGSGRHGEKLGILRVGGRVLSAVTGDRRWTELIDLWASGLADVEAHGYLISTILPAWIASNEYLPGHQHAGMSDLWLDEEGRLRINVPRIARWWQQNHPRHDTARAMQLGSQAAIDGELKGLGVEPGAPYGTGTKLRYRTLSAALSYVVMHRGGLAVEDGLHLPGTL